MKNYIVGLHACQAALKTQSTIIRAYFLKGRKDQKIQNIQQSLQKLDIPYEFLEKQLLDELAPAMNHQGIILEVSATQEYGENDLESLLTGDEASKILLMLDGVQDPHNLGACLRSCDAFGVTAIIAPKDNAVSLTPTVRKVACGGAETVPFIPVTNLVRIMKHLQERGFWIYGLSSEATENIYEASFTGNIVLVLGAEGRGLRQLTEKTCDALYHIPMRGTVESLNVSVAAGIVLAEAIRQRDFKRPS